MQRAALWLISQTASERLVTAHSRGDSLATVFVIGVHALEITPMSDQGHTAWHHLSEGDLL